MEMPLEFEEALARLKAEFLDSTRDRLDEVELTIDKIVREDGNVGDLLHDVRLYVHSLKGSAGSYGLNLVSVIAHRLEDYLETSPLREHSHWQDVIAFIDAIRGVVDLGDDPDDDRQSEILAALPSSAQREFTGQERRHVTILVVMPMGVQRKIVGSELAACGFDVSFCDSPMRAVELAVVLKPKAILSNIEFAGVSGLELSDVFGAIKLTRDIPFAVMTAHDAPGLKNRDPARPVGIIHKDTNFLENMTSYLMDAGLFGKLGKPS